MRCDDLARRICLLHRSSSTLITISLFLAVIIQPPAVLGADIPISTTTIIPTISDKLSLNQDQKAVTATKMIEKIRDESVERILRLKIGLPSTSSESEEDEDIFDDEEDQNVNDASPEGSSTMTPLTSSEAAAEISSPLRGRRSLRHSHHHRRRRKGCPVVHGKTQFLCPSRNFNRYDVCITREQLCNHIVDCPDGEDEDPKHCMFYQPIDDQLKTLSHAVLLLVDNVMSQNQPKSEL